MVVAEAGRDLFRAAICHPDATEEFLEEASEQFGPIVEATLFDDPEYRWRVTGGEAGYRYPARTVSTDFEDEAS